MVDFPSEKIVIVGWVRKNEREKYWKKENGK